MIRRDWIVAIVLGGGALLAFGCLVGFLIGINFPRAVKATATPVVLRPTLTPPVTPLPLPPPSTEEGWVGVPPTPVATPAPPPTPLPPGVTPERMMQLKDLPAIPLKDWPRPAGDNGRGIHFLPKEYYTENEVDYQIPRMVAMNMKWTVALYGDENYLEMAAKKFKAAGITVIWRKYLRPYEVYYDWERDIKLLESLGLPPYMQLYNEPELSAEWPDRPIDREVAMSNLLQSVEYVYNAGGYVGLQFVDPEWLRDALRRIKAHGGERVFGRMFFIPHNYGLNHPPDYDLDRYGVLGFRVFADVFRQEIGFVPPIIVGEGGWTVGAQEDSHFPPIDDQKHRDYHVEVFNWFRTGKLSNEEPLPDYLFAFCPWLIADPLQAGAWFDSFAGTRTLTIEAVKAMKPFTRKFSWER